MDRVHRVQLFAGVALMVRSVAGCDVGGDGVLPEAEAREDM